MKFTFTCKKISLNDSIKEYAEKKISSWTATSGRTPTRL